jgi:hypothetical protein
LPFAIGKVIRTHDKPGAKSFREIDGQPRRSRSNANQWKKRDLVNTTALRSG